MLSLALGKEYSRLQLRQKYNNSSRDIVKMYYYNANPGEINSINSLEIILTFKDTKVM